MKKAQWLWMQASVALVRTAAMAMQRDAAAPPPGVPPHRPPPAAPWTTGKP